MNCDKPELIRSLSEHHWNAGIDILIKNPSLKEQWVGNGFDWTFQVVRKEGEPDFIYMQTLFKNKVVSENKLKIE